MANLSININFTGPIKKISNSISIATIGVDNSIILYPANSYYNNIQINSAPDHMEPKSISNTSQLGSVMLQIFHTLIIYM